VQEDWYYAASDNRFDPFLELKQYDSCRKIAGELYAASIPADSTGLMGASYMYARIAIRNQQFALGLKWSLLSEKYGAHHPPQVLMAVYYDIAYCYEKLGQQDKAFAYYKLNKQLTDERDSATKHATAAYLNAQADFMKTELEFKKLQKEKEQGVFWRNAIIVAGLLLSGLVIFYLLRRKKKTELQKAAAEEKSAFFEKQFRTAAEELQQFRFRVEEHSRRMEELEAALAQKNEGNLNTEKIEALGRQIILTEKDWELFKQNFDAVYPGFFNRLKTQFTGITNAELRMAALLRLNFDIKHIASMLGISANSVHKTKYRLRDRVMESGSTQTLEEFLTQI
jgi:hypothetical protein